jgi:hypothetical protein
MYIYVSIYTHIYMYIYIERERGRERERKNSYLGNSLVLLISAESMLPCSLFVLTVSVWHTLLLRTKSHTMCMGQIIECTTVLAKITKINLQMKAT